MPTSVPALRAQPAVRRAFTFGATFGRLFGLPVLALVLSCAMMPVAQAAKWEPVPPADLAAKESTGFPGADVEILLSTHLMEEQGQNTLSGTTMTIGEDRLSTANFIRAKVYTAKGVEDMGKFPIRFRTDRQVTDTEARVVKQDGTVRELNKADIFESVLKKARGRTEEKQITFVFPGLEPGDVVEYRWTEPLGEELWLETFFCQETLPVREYRFRIGDMKARGSVGWMNCPKAEIDDKGGFAVTLRNIPAFEEEEFMPPLLEFRGWIYVAKTFQMFPTDKDVWKQLSLEWGDEFNTATRPGSSIKKKAEALTAGATTDDEKLSRLYQFCQNELFNTTYRTSAELQAEIEKHRGQSANSPAKTLELGRGRRDEINQLFAALARASGYEIRLACNASRNVIANVMISRGWAFMNSTRSVAVKVGGEWRYFNPGCYILPYGMMASDDESATTLLCDTKKVEYGSVAVSKASENQASRKGRFVLDAEGTLSGEAEEIFRGHLATTRKAETWSQSLDEATKDFREEITKRLPNAEVTGIIWTNLETHRLPVIVRYQVRVPGYAEQVGKRLVFAPGFFECGKPVVFAAAERKFPIMFSFPWEEHDDIEIVLPEGYTLDKPSAPQPVGDVAGPFGAAYNLQYSGKTRTFGFRRDFALGGNGAFAFRCESYPAVKALFELLHKSDTHSIVIKPKEKPAAAVPAPAPAVSQPAAPAQP
jgi:hypothetical protein